MREELRQSENDSRLDAHQETVKALESMVLNRVAGEAYQAAVKLPMTEKIEALERLQIDTTDVVAECLEEAAKIGSEYSRGKALDGLLEASIRVGKLQDCLMLYEEGYHRDEATAKAASLLAKSGQADEAIAIVKTIGSPYQRNKMWEYLAVEIPDNARAIFEGIHETVDLGTDGENKMEDKSYQARALTRLVAQIPQAGPEALELFKGSDRHYDLEYLCKLAQYEPAALSLASADLKKYIKHNDGRYLFDRDRQELEQRCSQLRDAVVLAAENRHFEHALEAAKVLGRSYREDAAHKIVTGALEAGQIDTAFAAARLNGDVLDTYIKALPQLKEQGRIDEALQVIRKSKGTIPSIIYAAAVLPELLPEAEQALDKKFQWRSDRSKALLKLAPAFVAEGRLGDLLKKADEIGISMGWEKLDLVKGTLPQLSVESVSMMMDYIAGFDNAQSKLQALALMAEYTPEAATMTVELFENVVRPALVRERDKQKAYGGYNAYDSITVFAANKLREAGCIDEAVRIAGGALYAATYVEAMLPLAVEHPEVIPRLTANIAKLSQGGAESLRRLVEDLPDAELSQVTTTLFNTKKSNGIRQIAAEAMGARLVAMGKSDELLELIPKRLEHDIGFLSVLGPQLIEAGEVELLRTILARSSRKVDRSRKVDIMLELLPTAPELAPDILTILKAKEEAASRGYSDRSSIIWNRNKALAAIAPYIPEAAQMALLQAQAMKVDSNDRYNYKRDLESFSKLLVGIARGGNPAGAFQTFIDKDGYFDSEFVFNEIAPTLVELGLTASVLDYARSMLSHEAKVKALANLIPAKEELTESSQMLSEIVGSNATEAAPHAISDRSINYSYFASDIAENPILVETFISRATSPAEVLAILKTVDVAVLGTAAGAELQYNALTHLERFGTANVLAVRWKENLQDQALGDVKVDAQRFKNLPNLQQLMRVVANVPKEVVIEILKLGYGVSQLYEHPWLMLIDNEELEKIPFPIEAPKSAQQEWLSDHAFVRLEGFSKRAIGQILQNRLSQNIEYSLHDASQWLESFQIKERVEVFDAESGQVEVRQLFDSDAEQTFLHNLMQADFSAEELRRLPGFASAGGDIAELKTQKFDQLFYDPAATLLYAAIIQARASAANHQANHKTVKSMLAEWSEVGLVQQWLGHGKEIYSGDQTDLLTRANTLLDSFAKPLDSAQNASEQLGHLRSLSKNRKEYVDSTTTWLRNFQNLPGQRLARAWGDRTDALAEGIGDNPSSIYEWSQASGLRSYINSRANANGQLPSGIPAKELLRRFSSFIPELVTRYDSPTVISALENLWQDQNLEADLPAYSVDISDGYTFKVFAKDDPAGMTIGHDTDCCMTLGGASSSCIFAGYTDPRFGFVGLYDEQDKLVAQSFVWHNQGTLVLDNIEAQRGRNLSRIQDRYKEALTKYLAGLSVTRPELNITKVNIGTGYLAAELSRGLEPTDPVPIPKDGIYTDSYSQVKLLEFAAEQLQQAANQGAKAGEDLYPTLQETSKLPANQPEIVSIESVEEGAETISRLEAQIYPQALTIGKDDILQDLQKPDNYSFLIGSRAGNGGIVGYVLAYREASEDAVYISDLAILGSEQRAGYGVMAMDYLFGQLAERGEKRVIFEARENTSYQAIQSQTAQALLRKHGFEIASSERLESYFENGEVAYKIRLETAV